MVARQGDQPDPGHPRQRGRTRRGLHGPRHRRRPV